VAADGDEGYEGVGRSVGLVRCTRRGLTSVWRPYFVRRLRAFALLRIVEVLYASRQYAPNEMLEAIRRIAYNPYRVQWGTVEVDRDGDGRWRRVPWQGEVT
jgi:hypothetical protein